MAGIITKEAAQAAAEAQTQKLQNMAKRLERLIGRRDEVEAFLDFCEANLCEIRLVATTVEDRNEGGTTEGGKSLSISASEHDYCSPELDRVCEEIEVLGKQLGIK